MLGAILFTCYEGWWSHPKCSLLNGIFFALGQVVITNFTQAFKVYNYNKRISS